MRSDTNEVYCSHLGVVDQKQFLTNHDAGNEMPRKLMQLACRTTDVQQTF
jgi:hypothetical protein